MTDRANSMSCKLQIVEVANTVNYFTSKFLNSDFKISYTDNRLLEFLLLGFVGLRYN